MEHGTKSRKNRENKNTKSIPFPLWEEACLPVGRVAGGRMREETLLSFPSPVPSGHPLPKGEDESFLIVGKRNFFIGGQF